VGQVNGPYRVLEPLPHDTYSVIHHTKGGNPFVVNADHMDPVVDTWSQLHRQHGTLSGSPAGPGESEQPTSGKRKRARPAQTDVDTSSDEDDNDQSSLDDLMPWRDDDGPSAGESDTELFLTPQNEPRRPPRPARASGRADMDSLAHLGGDSDDE
jgi:hypothetical protein